MTARRIKAVGALLVSLLLLPIATGCSTATPEAKYGQEKLTAQQEDKYASELYDMGFRNAKFLMVHTYGISFRVFYGTESEKDECYFDIYKTKEGIWRTLVIEVIEDESDYPYPVHDEKCFPVPEN